MDGLGNRVKARLGPSRRKIRDSGRVLVYTARMKNIKRHAHDNRDNYRRLITYYRRHLAEGVDAQLVTVYTREIAKVEAALNDLEREEQVRKTAA